MEESRYHENTRQMAGLSSELHVWDAFLLIAARIRVVRLFCI